MSIFRASALARFQSPEQLDQLMVAAAPRSWLGLAVVVTLLGCAGAWSVLGTIRTQVTGAGLILRPGGVFNIDSLGRGRVTEVLVEPGQTVQRGQVVARIAQPALELEVAATKAQRERLEAEAEKARALYADGDRLYAEQVAQQRLVISRQREQLNLRKESARALLELNRKALAEQRQQLDLLRGSLSQRLAFAKDAAAKLAELQRTRAVASREVESALEQRASHEERLGQTQTELARGAVTAAQTETTARRDADQIEESLHALDNQLTALAKEEVERTTRRREELFARAQTLADVKARLELSESRLDLAANVKSPEDGLVVEVMAVRGNVIEEGRPVASAERLEKQLEVAVFVPAPDGKKIQPGMRIEVTPSTVKREEHGYMIGRVRSVIAFPASDAAMLRLIPNHAVVGELRKGGVCVQVVGDLIPDASTQSGFQWSSGGGPNLAVHSGTMCECAITVREQPPITLVLPTLRKTLGVY